MCESEVIVEGSPDRVKDVVRVVIKEGKVICSTILGEEITIEAKVRAIDLLNHKIILEQRGE